MKHTSPPTPSLTGTMPVPTRHDDPDVPPPDAIADPDNAAADCSAAHDGDDECCALLRRAPGRRVPQER